MLEHRSLTLYLERVLAMRLFTRYVRMTASVSSSGVRMSGVVKWQPLPYMFLPPIASLETKGQPAVNHPMIRLRALKSLLLGFCPRTATRKFLTITP